jgi:hypothetical protein
MMYLLQKRGLWYREDACGYTSNLWDAGLYTKEDAMARRTKGRVGKWEERVRAVPLKAVIGGIRRDLKYALAEAQALTERLLIATESQE